MGKAYEVAKRIGSMNYMSIACANLADNYVHLNKLDSAQKYIDLAYKYYDLNPIRDDAQEFGYNGISASLALAKNDIKKAGHFLNIPFNEARIGSPYMLVYNRRKSEYFSRIKDYKRAFEYYKEYKKYDDSIKNIQNINNVTEIAARYSRDTTILKKDILISQSKAEISRNRGWLVFAISLLLIIVILVIVYLQYLRTQRRKEYQRNYANIVKLRMEANAARLSPHFIFNVMNTLVPRFSDDDSGREVVNHMINLFRATLSSNGVLTSLSSELEMLKNYAALSKIIHPCLPELSLDIDSSVDLSMQIPTMLLHTSVENSLKYAFPGYESYCPEGNILSLSIKDTGENVFIVVEDNGIGFLSTQIKISSTASKGTGNGILILNRTIKLFNSSNVSKILYNIEDLSEINSDAHGTRVTITLPKAYNYKLI